jgi:hypothetical protein
MSAPEVLRDHAHSPTLTIQLGSGEIFEHLAGASLDFSGAGILHDSIELRAQASAQETLIPKVVLFHAAQSRGIKWATLNEYGLASLVADTHVEQKLVVSAAIDYGFIELDRQDKLNNLEIHGELLKLSDHALSTEQFLEKSGENASGSIGKRTTTLSPKAIRLPIGYVNAVVDAYRNRQISPAKAAEYLIIDEQELTERFGDIYENVDC